MLFVSGEFLTADIYIFTGGAWEKAEIFCYLEGEWKEKSGRDGDETGT